MYMFQNENYQPRINSGTILSHDPFLLGNNGLYSISKWESINHSIQNLPRPETANIRLYKGAPKLVEKNLKQFFTNKLKLKKKKFLEKQQFEDNNTFIYKLKSLGNYIMIYLLETIKEYYGFIILLALMIILLYVRYIEINNRKKDEIFIHLMYFLVKKIKSLCFKLNLVIGKLVN